MEMTDLKPSTRQISHHEYWIEQPSRNLRITIFQISLNTEKDGACRGKNRYPKNNNITNIDEYKRSAHCRHTRG